LNEHKEEHYSGVVDLVCFANGFSQEDNNNPGGLTISGVATPVHAYE
jgi:hypothetical protein